MQKYFCIPRSFFQLTSNFLSDQLFLVCEVCESDESQPVTVVQLEELEVCLSSKKENRGKFYNLGVASISLFTKKSDGP